MKPSVFALLAILVLAASSGCCRIEQFWRYGCGYHGEFGPYYQYEGPDADRYCDGYCSNCAEVGRRDYSGDAAAAAAHTEESAEPEPIDGIRVDDAEPMDGESRDPGFDGASWPGEGL